ncbi:hypothetical protein VA7868_03810 [Vibrio aerogenes CECT 7868]|uniref:DUF445 domain-containing protein n=1 Tax=Vibrio aerogenes CECT 7868 TaxID=1216006 RepID=A0A1M6BIT4_9VIBR|nr:DUF445 domain-containing protein [Vibrio aerogenes]SHI48403.1 hypothetical protein VA7868_03810 [Vibrio aerogenes CECT 7868]
MNNKSIMTNFIAILCMLIGYQFNEPVIQTAGLFAFSGAITNWLAIHMLFEKVPGLYGSGVIPRRFDAFRTAIKSLMMEQFFSQENIGKFLDQEIGETHNFEMDAIIETIDFNPTFDALVDVIAHSQFGGMLAMVGGTEALQPLKQPFVEKMHASVAEIGQSEAVQDAIKSQLGSGSVKQDIEAKIEQIIDQRLSELTPQLVKDMVQKMIKEHLGWLVIWGGVFGGVIGIVASLI